MAEDLVLIGADLGFHGEDFARHLLDQGLAGNYRLAVIGQGGATVELPATVEFIGDTLAKYFIVRSGYTAVQFHVFTVFIACGKN